MLCDAVKVMGKLSLCRVVLSLGYAYLIFFVVLYYVMVCFERGVQRRALRDVECFVDLRDVGREICPERGRGVGVRSESFDCVSLGLGEARDVRYEVSGRRGKRQEASDVRVEVRGWSRGNVTIEVLLPA
jgi:hypothetical protein